MEELNNQYKKEYKRREKYPIEFYQCFSRNQKIFLENKGIKPILDCRHKVTYCPMWIFLFDNQNILSDALTEWSDTNPYNNYD